VGLSGVEHLAYSFFLCWLLFYLFLSPSFFAAVPFGIARSEEFSLSSLLYVCVCLCVLSLYTPGLRTTIGPSEFFYLLHRRKRTVLNTAILSSQLSTLNSQLNQRFLYSVYGAVANRHLILAHLVFPVMLMSLSGTTEYTLWEDRGRKHTFGQMALHILVIPHLYQHLTSIPWSSQWR
jgi:hypothetical protein